MLRKTTASAILACFFQEDKPDTFRLTLITRSINAKGEIDYSNPKRQSFVLGKGVKTRFAQKQFAKLIQATHTLTGIQEAFALEPLSKEFFDKISEFFLELTFSISFPLAINDNEDRKRQFSLRLIARILFCKFLEEKKIIPSKIWDTTLSQDYYHNILESLFFLTLNTAKQKRNYGLLEEKITKLLDSIPYLNGGLFAPQADDFFNPSKPNSHINTLKIPNEAIQKLLNILEEYHFTIDESTPLDQEVGLDPEMLGMVFESLLSVLFTDNRVDNLSSLRKKTGSYYTPREIVSYMVKNSILQYLKTQTGLDETALRELVFDYTHSFEHSDILRIMEALQSFKILDPACGSGAFPMGMLQEICAILEALDSKAKAFLNLQNENFKAQNQGKNPTYIRKLSILQNNIYGVDIQPMATEIARLRCFLSLICDEDSQIQPLPNLEFKFVNANSLLPIPKKENLRYPNYNNDKKELERLRKKTFESASDKASLETEYLALANKIAKNLVFEDEISPIVEWNPYNPQSVAEFFDSEFMFGFQNFDCVIGNPPYGVSLTNEEKIRYRAIFNSKSSDTAQLFILQSDKLLKPNGVNSLIVPKALTFATNWKQIRDFLQKDLRQIIDCGKAWSYVLLEMIIFTKIKQSSTKSYTTGFLSEGRSLSQMLEIDKQYIDLFDFYLNDLTKEELAIGISIRNKFSHFLMDCGENYRGDIFYQHITKNGDCRVLGGKEIQRYYIKGVKGYIAKDFNVRSSAFIKDNAVLTQRLIAHIENPTPHIKMTGTIIKDSKDIRIVDTIYQIVCKKEFSNKFILALLHSRFLNWYCYRFVFAKAIRTFQFSSEIAKRIPIPKIDSTNKEIADKIIALVEKILKAKENNPTTDTKPLESQIDSLVYTLYNLTEAEIQIIENKE
ncbi:hypothetical protein BBW65_06070 [Helicobacter enhydrae]|uniref:site-specific DNA-methyltransferase (adenine-specific) n=1 Tax=Helicobacter enhydrae TaxID=222136 RepID=A0A1B1U6M2_9HELI|nr:DNA methyltransferase [Helicobacter enhydrae]ANV98386.1 hypothetical protein BBW65_06070 [Helicobacter enhydrae]